MGSSAVNYRGMGPSALNCILNGLHPPANMSGIAHVDKWLTFPDMRHIVANYYNRCVVLLTNHEIGKSESFFPLRGPPPAKQKVPSCVMGQFQIISCLFF